MCVLLSYSFNRLVESLGISLRGVSTNPVCRTERKTFASCNRSGGMDTNLTTKKQTHRIQVQLRDVSFEPSAAETLVECQVYPEKVFPPVGLSHVFPPVELTLSSVLHGTTTTLHLLPGAAPRHRLALKKATDQWRSRSASSVHQMHTSQQRVDGRLCSKQSRWSASFNDLTAESLAAWRTA